WPEIRDYGDVIKQPMWLKKIRNNLLEKKYASITEPIADLRLILENCYRYNGPDNSISKRALKLETILEQKLALLPKELKEKTSIEVTSGEFFDEQNGNTSKKKTYSTLVEGGHSLLLERVKHERSQREKEFKRKLMEEKKAEKEAAYRKAVDWENTLLNQDNISAMKAMWELPQIGHFLYLTQLTLNIPEVSQFELERMMLMPRQSSLLPTIMTSLLANPNGRSNLDKRPPMKYRIWQEKLKQRVMKWYQLLRSKNNSPLAVFERYGIEPNFFSVMGLVNPLEEGQFHELNFHQRVWLLKSLCDYCLNTHKTIQEVISEQSIVDQKEVILGSDIRGNIYIHFPQFCGQDLRIYRQVGWVPPSIDFSLANGKQKAPVIRTVRKPPEPIKKELANDDATTPGSHRRPSHLRQKLKAVKRQDMICENPRGDVYESMEVDESNPEGDSLSGDVSLSPVKNNENDAKPLPSEVPEDSLDDRVDVDAVARECDEDASDASCSKLAKGGKNKRPETPPINTNLSEAIIQFDLEKELAISIRGRCSRPRDGSSGDDKNDDKKKSRKRFKADDESGCEDVVSEDDGFHGDNEKIKIEEGETGRVKSEDNSDDESGPKVKEELKNEEEEEEETIDRKMFDIKIEDYLPSDTYEPPDLNKFELVVDSMESLKELIDGLLKEEDVVNANKEKAGRSKVPRLSRIQKNEIELRNRLRNLRVELDPWKDKLIQAVKRTLQRLKKEWDDYDPKSEELTGVDLWESDSDDEKGNDDNKTVKSSSDEELDGAESGRIKTRYLKAKNKLKRKAERESGEAKVEPVTVSSRGRVRKSLLKKDGIYEYGEDNVASKDVDGSDNFKPDD
ncbi:KIAA2026 (predicted), partial [Pycnogonum litorale]